VRFAFVPERRFEGVDWHPAAHGIPRVNGAIAAMECRIEQRIPAGDHTILIGEVIAAELLTDARPLLYFGSGYRKVAP
jgi:flavin reductase (DIM6/NTAB) family NADH-FMN oxidoreductase RutF